MLISAAAILLFLSSTPALAHDSSPKDCEPLLSGQKIKKRTDRQNTLRLSGLRYAVEQIVISVFGDTHVDIEKVQDLDLENLNSRSLRRKMASQLSTLDLEPIGAKVHTGKARVVAEYEDSLFALNQALRSSDQDELYSALERVAGLYMFYRQLDQEFQQALEEGFAILNIEEIGSLSPGNAVVIKIANLDSVNSIAAFYQSTDYSIRDLNRAIERLQSVPKDDPSLGGGAQRAASIEMLIEIAKKNADVLSLMFREQGIYRGQVAETNRNGFILKTNTQLFFVSLGAGMRIELLAAKP